MDKALEQKYEELEKRVAALEGRVQVQPKGKLEFIEKRKIKESLIHVLAFSNLSINQSKEIFEEICHDFKNCRPWTTNYSSSEKDQL